MDWTTIISKIKSCFDMNNAIEAQFVAFWAADVLFSWRWWLKVAMLLLPWVFWAIVRKRDSTARLLLAAFFVMAVSIYLDEIGVSMGLWYYPATIQPYVSGNSAYNISMLPVATMLFIQFFPKVKPVYKALAFAALGTFVSEPLMVWMGLYRNVEWSYWYSFPILFVQYWIAHKITLMKSFAHVEDR